MTEIHLTGADIHARIVDKITELRQYELTLEKIQHVGTKYSPYILLEEQRNKVQEELNTLLTTDFKKIEGKW